MRRFSTCMVAMALLMSACGGRNETQTVSMDGLEFDSVVVDTTMALGTSTDAPQCHIRLSVQYAKGKNEQQVNNAIVHSGILVPDYFAIGRENLSMEHVVDSFVGRYLNDYQNVYGDFYRMDKEHASLYNNDYILSTHTQKGKKDIVIYLANSYLHAGGSYGSAITIAKNIDVEKGRIVELKDVFVPGYEQQLCELIEEKLLKRFDVKTLDDLHKQSVFSGIDIYAPENFMMEEDQMTFIYVEDEVAPHALGEIRVSIPYNELNGILKK